MDFGTVVLSLEVGHVLKCTLNVNIVIYESDYIHDDNDDTTDNYLPPADVRPFAPQHITQHKIMVNGVDAVVSSTSELLASQFVNVKQQILQKLQNRGYDVPHDDLNDIIPTE